MTLELVSSQASICRPQGRRRGERTHCVLRHHATRSAGCCGGAADRRGVAVAARPERVLALVLLIATGTVPLLPAVKLGQGGMTAPCRGRLCTTYGESTQFSWRGRATDVELGVDGGLTSVLCERISIAIWPTASSDWIVACIADKGSPGTRPGGCRFHCLREHRP